MFTNILLPTDGLKVCEDAVGSGIKLAKSLKAKVTGVHVTPKLSPRELLHAYHPEMLWSRDEAEKAQEAMNHLEALNKSSADKYLSLIERLAGDAGVESEIVYIQNESPSTGIIKVAKEKGCDLIFIASHSKGGLAGAILGTVTTKILAKSNIPVLVHRCD